jgi:hypothetical protein
MADETHVSNVSFPETSATTANTLFAHFFGVFCSINLQGQGNREEDNTNKILEARIQKKT